MLFVGVIIFERKTKLVSDMRANTYTYVFLAPFFAMIGIAMTFIVSKYIIQLLKLNFLIKIKRFAFYIGKNTFAIMCLHPLAFKLVGLVQVNYFGYDKELLLDWGVVGYDVPWLVIDCIAGILIPISVSSCVKYFLHTILMSKHSIMVWRDKLYKNQGK